MAVLRVQLGDVDGAVRDASLLRRDRRRATAREVARAERVQRDAPELLEEVTLGNLTVRAAEKRLKAGEVKVKAKVGGVAAGMNCVFWSSLYWSPTNWNASDTFAMAGLM